LESNRNYATPVYLSSIDTGEKRTVVVISGLGDRSRIPLRGEDDDAMVLEMETAKWRRITSTEELGRAQLKRLMFPVVQM
jgi:hypothetical protein